MKIICAGLSKTGTKSLAKALRILGFTVFDFDEHDHFHIDKWFDVYCEGKSPDFASMYKDVDAVTDLPPAFWFEEIYGAFPDAKVILSVRDNEEVWAHSWAKQNELIQTFSGFLNRVLVKWPLFIVRRIRGKYTKFELFDFVLNGVYGSLNSRSTVLFKKKYREHNQRVQAVIPKQKLLIYNVKQGWEPLCEFLGCDFPQVEFPRENFALSFTHRKIATWRQMAISRVLLIVTVLVFVVKVFYKPPNGFLQTLISFCKTYILK